MLPDNFKIQSLMAPCLTTINGKRLAMPGWIEVPMETDINELLSHWECVTIAKTQPIKEKEELNTHISVWVPSSKGLKNAYEVTFNGVNWSCTCSGYGFRRKCRHINQVKKETKCKNKI